MNSAPSPLTVARAQTGDRAAMDAVLRGLQEPLLVHVEAIVHDRELALDVMQEVLWQIARKLGSVRDPRWVRAWAYRIATRQAIRRSAADRPWRDAVRDEPAAHHFDERADEVPDALDRDEVDAIRRQVATLPPACRIVIRLHYLEGLTIDEVAEALEISTGTTKSRLSYGLGILRRAAAPR